MLRLLILFSSHHLNTNFGNTKIFIPSLLSLGHCVQHNNLGLYLEQDRPMTFHSSFGHYCSPVSDNILALSLLVIPKRHNYTWIIVSITYVVLACFVRYSISKFQCDQSRPKAHWGNLQIFVGRHRTYWKPLSFATPCGAHWSLSFYSSFGLLSVYQRVESES